MSLHGLGCDSKEETVGTDLGGGVENLFQVIQHIKDKYDKSHPGGEPVIENKFVVVQINIIIVGVVTES